MECSYGTEVKDRYGPVGFSELKDLSWPRASHGGMAAAAALQQVMTPLVIIIIIIILTSCLSFRGPVWPLAWGTAVMNESWLATLILGLLSPMAKIFPSKEGDDGCHYQVTLDGVYSKGPVK